MRAFSLAVCGALLLRTVAAGAEPAPATRHRAPWPKPALGMSHSGGPEVVFTFDDGPQTGSTDVILDTLRQHGVRAIFFVVGHRIRGARVKAHALVKRMIEERHLVGNHTTNHMDLCLRANRPQMDNEIDETRRALQALTSMAVPLFRAPYGARCGALEEALGTRGLRHLHWDIDPQEWCSHDASSTARSITAHIGSLRDDPRAVILIHDTKQSAVSALPMILEWIVSENARRDRVGRKRIRIVDPAEIVVEMMAPGVEAALEDASRMLLDFFPDLERRLFGPLGLPMAKVAL